MTGRKIDSGAGATETTQPMPPGLLSWAVAAVAFVVAMLLLLAEARLSAYSGGQAAISGVVLISAAIAAPFVATRRRVWLLAVLALVLALVALNWHFLNYMLVIL